MTTLHVDLDALRTAVAPYPSVKDVAVTTDFPHGMRIEVIQHVAVAAVGVEGRDIPVSADGTLLRRTSAKGLPVLRLRTPPAGDRIQAGSTARILGTLGAAPEALLRRVEKVYVGARGLTMRLDSGVALYFGSTERPAAKWAAAARVLADPSSKGATYLDLRLPERPAAGGLEQVAAQREQTMRSGGTAPGGDGQQAPATGQPTGPAGP
jgi:cell division protein FtsQ